MSQKTFWSILVLAAAGSLAAVAALAAAENRVGVTSASLAFTLVIAAAALATNAPLWRQGSSSDLAAAKALASTTRLTALAYGWSGATLLAIYLLTHVRWQHGWQYGSAFVLIGLGLLAYARKMDSTRQEAAFVAPNAGGGWIAVLSALHGFGAAGAVAWLALSGKLDTTKGDWAANAVFIAGGLAVVATSAMFVKTHAALTSHKARAGH
jgi:hypothetical protein